MSFAAELNKLHDPEFLVENWDGYDAPPLDPHAFTHCLALVSQWRRHSDFPLPDPDPVPCNDGNIALEWDQGGKGDRRILSVIPQSDAIIYAILDTRDTPHYCDHGRVSLDDDAGIERIRQLVKRFVPQEVSMT
jgi:hypothetical protein